MARFRTDKDQFILDRCRGKRVLDIGCVNHTLEAAARPDWRHGHLKKVASELVGLDYEEAAVQKLRSEGYNIIAADAQDFDIRDKYPQGFEVVVASEIVEHLVNPGGFLTSIRKHLAPGGVLLLSTPHAYGLGFFLEILVFGEEVINDDHTMTFSKKNMHWLMKKSGMKVKEFHWLIQDSSRMPVHTTAGARLAAKIFFWLQCIAATIRPGYSKEMIVIAEPA